MPNKTKSNQILKDTTLEPRIELKPQNVYFNTKNIRLFVEEETLKKFKFPFFPYIFGVGGSFTLN